ncbi:MAG: YHS domain-containing protein [Fimbriimonadales bacterium]|nr:YHS domain-containing protein [Fimbriimonadales bacterium]
MKNWLVATTIALTFALTVSATAQTRVATNTKGKKPAVTCIVSGETIENLSKAPRYTYKGKTYYFCCTKCLNKFKASPTTYLNRKPVKANAQAKPANKACCSTEQSGSSKACCNAEQGGCCSDEKAGQTAGKSCCSDKQKTAKGGEQTTAGEKGQTTDQQSAESVKLFCPVSEEEITPSEAVAFEYSGKRYYVCCSNCKRKFLADPETYAKKAEQLSPLQGKPVEKGSQ